MVPDLAKCNYLHEKILLNVVNFQSFGLSFKNKFINNLKTKQLQFFKYFTIPRKVQRDMLQNQKTSFNIGIINIFPIRA